MKRTIRVESIFDVLMRVHVNGSDATRTDITSITWRVLLAADSTEYHAGGTLTVSSAVFNTLQTDGRWSTDSTGYNFRHSVAHDVITDIGEYVIDYTFTTASGGEFHERYALSAVSITQAIYE